MRVIPPSQLDIQPELSVWARWKTIILPGLLGSVVLVCLQFLIIFLFASPIPGTGPTPGFPFLPGSNAVIFGLVLLSYFAIPALLARLITAWTRQPTTAYRAGRFVGVLCAIVLSIATITYHPPQPASSIGTISVRYSPISGLGLAFTQFILYLLSVLCHVGGIYLAMLGAFLGSGSWRQSFSRQASSHTEDS